MLFSHSIINIAFISLCLFKSQAAPIKSSYNNLYVPEAGFLLTESLSEYYENIVDQIMLDNAENVLSYLPELICQEQVEACQSVEKSLDRNLNFMRASLLASVNPLISTDIPQISGLTTIQNEATLYMLESSKAEDSEAPNAIRLKQIQSSLLESILILNKKISHQLGLIINADQSSSILVRQASSHSLHSTSSSGREQQEQSKSTIITVEWKLRQPFQIKVLRESTDVIVPETQTKTAWLFDQLSSVEGNLLHEFNVRAQEAVQLVMESLALDV